MRSAAAFVCAAFAAACGANGSDLDIPQPRPLAPPAGAGAAQPFVAAGAGDLILSWTEPADRGHALRFARFDGSGWSPVRTVAEGADWFVNWADFPSVVALPDDRLAAHWLQRSGPGRYSYDVMITTSADGGATWTAPVRPHHDGTETEHGFVALFPFAGGLGAVWLDGRRYADGPHGAATKEMEVRFTSFAPDGTAGEERVIDQRACDCCQTAIAAADAGPVVFFRDRSAGEVRDISTSRLVDGRWTEPRRVHADDWEINACPVNGPAAAANGNTVAVAWFTAAADTPRVRVAFSDDGGASFGAPIPVDDGDPVGRVDLLLVDGDRALVVWLERVGTDAEVRGRLIHRSGETGAARTLAATTAGRSGGFPRMSRNGSDVLLAWTEPGDPSRVRAALLQLAARP
jgi:hypothetical protein